MRKSYTRHNSQHENSYKVWDISLSTSHKCRPLVIEGHGNQDVTFCDISPNEDYLASSSVDGTVKVWHTENGEPYKMFYPEKEDLNKAVRCCRFSSANEILIAGLDNGKIVKEYHFLNSYAIFWETKESEFFPVVMILLCKEL
ncbi:apoptotic protease-activating factor 1 [Trichonephila clavipes]|nr:apoptotic protease-activating factor 1 [Trichonephila clavipes]